MAAKNGNENNRLKASAAGSPHLGSMMLDGLLGVSRVIDAVNIRIGKWVAWLVVAAVMVSTVNAISRKAFDLSSNAWLELQWYLFSAVFLLCASWTLIANEHIRVDILNNLMPKRVQHWIDVFGHIFFLIPFTIVIVWTGWPFFLASYRIGEWSGSAGGLLVWPVKLLVPVGFMLLFLQGISELIKRIAVIQGRIPDPYVQERPIEAEVMKAIDAVEKRD